MPNGPTGSVGPMQMVNGFPSGSMLQSASSLKTFAGMSGSTTGTYRFQMCHSVATPVRHSTWGAVKSFYR